MDLITDKLGEAVEEIRSQICEAYGAPPDEENAAQVNSELAEFVQEVTEEALDPVREAIRRLLEQPGANAGAGAQAPAQGMERRLSSLEAKLDALLARSAGAAAGAVVGPAGPQPLVVRRNNGRNLWARYQKAWTQWKRGLGQEIPVHAGERSKLCAADYKPFKAKNVEEQEEFLAQYGA